MSTDPSPLLSRLGDPRALERLCRDDPRHSPTGYPRPISLGQRVAAWPEHEVDAVIAAHIREVAEGDFAQLVTDIHTQRSTFGLGASAGAPTTTARESPAA